MCIILSPYELAQEIPYCFQQHKDSRDSLTFTFKSSTSTMHAQKNSQEATWMRYPSRTVQISCVAKIVEGVWTHTEHGNWECELTLNDIFTVRSHQTVQVWCEVTWRDNRNWKQKLKILLSLKKNHTRDNVDFVPKNSERKIEFCPFGLGLVTNGKRELKVWPQPARPCCFPYLAIVRCVFYVATLVHVRMYIIHLPLRKYCSP